MSKINLNLSQSALNNWLKYSEESGIVSGSLDESMNETFDFYIYLNNNYFNDLSSAKKNNNQITYKYAEGETETLTVLFKKPYLESGEATVTQVTKFVPNKAKTTIKGDISAYFFDIEYYDAKRVFLESIKIETQPGSGSDFGNATLELQGDLSFDSDSQATGSISKISASATKIFKDIAISGHFNINNSYYYDYGYGDSSFNFETSGHLTKYTMRFHDGSVIDLDYSSSPVMINGNERILDNTLNNPISPEDDEITISLPKEIYEPIIIDSGDGNDNITLSGGGGNLHLNTGSGNDTVTIKSDNHYILTGSGNDTITGGKGVETLVYDGVKSSYILKKTSDGKLTIMTSEKTDTAYNVEWLEFSDGSVSVAALPTQNSAPTATSIIAAAKASEGKAFTYSLPKGTFSDADKGDVLTYSLGNQPTGMTVDAKTGKINWAPGYDAADKPTKVTITATDSRGESASTELSINVTNTANIVGTKKADNLIAGNGPDTLTGAAGNDSLSGGAGDDTLTGGQGADRLTGGQGKDLFDFNVLPELGLGNVNRDVITDFTASEGDRIDLSTIDANSSLKGDQAFVLVESFTTTAGQVRFATDSQGNGVIYINTDKDVEAEYEILLTGITTLDASDLVL